MKTENLSLTRLHLIADNGGVHPQITKSVFFQCFTINIHIKDNSYRVHNSSYIRGKEVKKKTPYSSEVIRKKVTISDVEISFIYLAFIVSDKN